MNNFLEKHRKFNKINNIRNDFPQIEKIGVQSSPDRAFAHAKQNQGG